jgi:hypothetical protein
MFFKLPSAWWSGVRLVTLSKNTSHVKIRHKWFNQNPFKSMFWAAQGMAAEFATGVMVIRKIKESGAKISMLVAQNKASFTKKAKGVIVFSCEDGDKIDQAIDKTIETGEGQTFWMCSKGVDSSGDVVSTFEFEWTVKLKQ